ncbi:MAG: hypothetical protein DHS20C18_16610 [Saprospiraceae bacterium]|nr:MAG: hypothetical protein DHS20C18_16610 [Saprospiraceae bacterium]
MRQCILVILLLSHLTIQAQEEGTSSDYQGVAAVVFLDSFVVTASRQGFNVEEFIKLVMEDKSFYEAFQNLRLVAYSAQNAMTFFDKRGKQKAAYSSITRQEVIDRCRTMEILEEQTSGNFYKRKAVYKYYTAKMFDRIFFTQGQVCEPLQEPDSADHLKGINKHIAELKKLIFQPGQEVDVPFIGNKTAIFDTRMAEYYQYSITSAVFNNKDCYLFTAKVKPDYEEKKVGKTIIKNMETFFEKETFQVVGRNYQMFYQGTFFDFDVQMKVSLTKVKDRYIPTQIDYRGSWNIPTKKPEIGSFSVRIFDIDQASNQ